MTSKPRINETAAQGFSAAAAGYVRGRPEYPEAIVGWLTSELGLSPGSTVVDLGSGTGKFLPRLNATGAAISAIEPVAEMRAEAMRRHPAINFHAGTAEAIPLADASADAVVCAQSFHWFATPVALAEIARVLKPDGALGLVWNVRDERVPWVAALTDIMAPYEGNIPRYASGAWRRLFPGHGFAMPAETIFAHGHTGTPESVVVDRVLSVSFIAALPEPERARVRSALERLIAETPALAGQSEVTFPYATHAYALRRA